MSVETQDSLFAATLGGAQLSAQPGGVMVYSATGEYRWANDAAARYLGVPRESLPDLCLPRIEALMGPGFKVQADQAMRTGQTCYGETSLTSGDNGGPPLGFQLARAEILGQPVLLVLVSPVGDHREGLAAAHASVERYQLLADATSDLIYSYDTALTLTGINRPAACVLGLEPSEAVGKPLADLGFPEPTLLQWTRMTEAALVARQAVREIVEATMPDGQSHAYETVLQPVLDETGRVAGFWGASRDITELKRIENELRKSEERFRGIFEQGATGVVLVNPDHSIARANPAFCQMLGYEESELLALKIANITAPEDANASLEGTRALYAGERSVLTLEKRYRRKDGSLIWGSLSASVVRGDDGRPLGSVATVQDITARKEMEESLRRTQFIVDHSQDLVHWMSPEGRFLYVNEASCRRLGYSREELLGMSVVEVDPLASSTWSGRFQEIRERGSSTFESVHRTKSGETFPVEVTADYVAYGGEEYSCASARDITERKRAEREWQVVSHAIEHAGIGALRLDEKGRIREVNGYLCRLLGYSREELLHLTAFDLTVGLDEDAWPARWKELKGLGPVTFEKDYRTSSGEIVPVEISSSIVEFEGVEYDHGFVRDISERKAAERAVRASEDRYQTLVNLSPDAMIVNVGGKYAFANPAAARLLGAGSPQEIVGQDVMERIHPDDRELIARRAAQVFAGRVSAPVEIKLLRLDGSPVHVEAAAARIEFDGSPASQVIFRDVTERKRAEELLRLTQFSVNHAADSVFWTNSDGRLIFVSDSSCQLHGYTRDEMLELTLFDIDPSLSAAQWATNWKRMKEQGSFTFETVSRAKDGTIFPVEVAVNYLEFDGTEYNCAFVRDITDRARAEEERLELEHRLQQSQRLESLGVLAGGIAHDFNNILMSVLGNAELALGGLSSASSARGNLLEIMSSSHRAADLCRQMLAYSGRGHLVTETIDLGALIEDMRGFLQSSISKKAVLNLNLGRELPSMRGDAGQISQIVMNLVLNASEAIGEQRGAINISTGITECSGAYLKGAYGEENLPAGRYLTLEVADTGAGMDKATQERIFEPFFTTKFSGRGLGLSAVLGIARGHQGALMLHSEPGRGTVFQILFPVSETVAGSSACTDGVPEDDWHGEGTILLVDDEEAIRTLGVAMLSSLGFKVVTAADGREALSVYAERRDDIVLVLLDLTMPYMDGEETLRELRLVSPEVPVVMSSGYAQTDVAARFAGKGLAGFVHKPYSRVQLRGQLRAALVGNLSLSRAIQS